MSRYLGNRPEIDPEPEAISSDLDSVSRRSTRKRRRYSVGRGLRWGCSATINVVLFLAMIVALLGVVGAVAGYLYLNDELSGAIDQVAYYQGQGPGGTPRFFDRHGTLLFELKTAEKRRWLNYDEIPLDVINATVAVEDDTFWTNPGFDTDAMLAAVISNYRNPEQRPVGASTITQQLVRHIAFSYEERVIPSYERKVREIFLAYMLNQRRSKHDILTMYLNEIYYGNLAYGIEAAAQTYFKKSAADLNLSEAALLASLPQAPYELDPYSNLEGAIERQHFVLDLMVSEGSISSEKSQLAKQEKIVLAPLIPPDIVAAEGILEAPHFILYVQNELERRYGPEALTRGGWQIITSIDLNLQKYAEQVAREWVTSRADQHDVNNAGIVVLKPGTGEILAMVGSLDYFNQAIDGQVNVTLQPRQPGSSIKPVTYVAAMERGWTTADVIWDVPIELNLGGGQWMVPRNYDGRYHGPLLLRDALANSYNIPPIQLIRDIGVPAFINTGRKMGIESLTEPPGYYGLALTLGGGEVPLLEMTTAYATLANQGQRPHLTSVLKITDSRDRFIFESRKNKVPAVNAVDPRIAYIITDILDDDAARAPAMGRYNDLALPFPAAAKTGTTNDFRDNWTLGYTPGVVVGVWVGNTDGHPMQNSSGLRGAAPLWRTLMEHIHDDPALLGTLAVDGRQPATEFLKPGGIEEREICLPRGTGGSTCAAQRTDLFRSGGPIHGIQRLGYVPDVTTNPGAWTLAVAPLSTIEAQQISLPSTESGLRPPMPTQCVVNQTRPDSEISRQLLLPLPPYYPDEVIARRWASQYGYRIAPPVVCSARTAPAVAGSGESAFTEGGDSVAPISAQWRIDSPAPGEQISGAVPILGSVDFDPAEVQYYKLEIGAGTSPTTWTTFGSTHRDTVSAGVLETLQADALPPGNYVIRLIVVRNDGNYPAPHSVPVTIVR